jgi:hypothetical protein
VSDDLITGIIRTRAEMATATRRDGDAILRRLLQRHQAAWNALGIPSGWLNADVHRLRERIARAEAEAAAEAEAGKEEL